MGQAPSSAGYGITTAQITYRMPDHLSVLQEFIWQRYDSFPDFPALSTFLAFWEAEIEGPIHSVTVAHFRLLKPMDLERLRGLALH